MAQPPPQNVAPTTPPGKPAMPPLPPRPGTARPPRGRRCGTVRAGPGPMDPSQIAALQQPGAEGEMHEGEVAIHHGFWQQPWVQDILPFITSLALHAAIVIVGLLLYEGIKQVAELKPLEEQIVIPEAAMANEVAGGVENPGLGDPTRAAAQDKYDENTTPDGTAFERSDSNVAEAAGGGEGDASNALIGGGTSSFGAGSKFGTGEGDGTGGGHRLRQGTPRPLRRPRRRHARAQGQGLRQRRQRPHHRLLLRLLRLHDRQVPLPQAGTRQGHRGPAGPSSSSASSSSPTRSSTRSKTATLVSATTENKRKANKWLDDLTTSGTSNPIPGLEVAFRAKPELMYILTDGDFPNNNEVLSKVASLNSGKRTRINTIAFVTSSDDATSESFMKFLTTLADSNNGKFKRVAQDQLD